MSADSFYDESREDFPVKAIEKGASFAAGARRIIIDCTGEPGSVHLKISIRKLSVALKFHSFSLHLFGHHVLRRIVHRTIAIMPRKLTGSPIFAYQPEPQKKGCAMSAIPLISFFILHRSYPVIYHSGHGPRLSNVSHARSAG